MNRSPHVAITNRRRRAGFTLAEILVTMLVLTLISGAVMTSFLFFNRSGISLGHYTDMDRQARSALERFAVDVRMAQQIRAFSSTRVQFRVPTGDQPIDVAAPTNFYEVNYTLFGGAFLREVVDSQGSATAIMPISAPQTLISGITELEFTRYGIGSPIDPDIPEATNVAETTQINIRLKAVRNWGPVREASNVVLSARYVLRNRLN